MMLENKAIAVFEDLLRAGLWGTPLNGLWKELKEEEWKQVLWLARQQTVQGLVFDGLQEIKDTPSIEETNVWTDDTDYQNRTAEPIT